MKTPREARRDAHELWRACLTDGTLDEARARAVVDLMLRGRRSGAQAVLKQFFRLLRLHDAEHTAIVASAAPLVPPLRAEIEMGLARLYGSRVTATFVVDPSLIGGVRVQVGSDVYDGSVRAGLAALESRF
jgi:F-type H+-transporting ATPase subunit delta